MRDLNIDSIAATVADDMIFAARNSGAESIVFVTGSSFVPALRSYSEAEDVWQDEDPDVWEYLVELIERRLDKARVLLDAPEYDNCLYVVDLKRFEYIESDGDNLSDDWQSITEETN